MAKKKEKRFRSKEDLGEALDRVIGNSKAQHRDIINAIVAKGKILGFGDGPNFFKVSTDQRWELGRKVIKPVLESLFNIEVVDDGPGEALRTNQARDPDRHS